MSALWRVHRQVKNIYLLLWGGVWTWLREAREKMNFFVHCIRLTPVYPHRLASLVLVLKRQNF